MRRSKIDLLKDRFVSSITKMLPRCDFLGAISCVMEHDFGLNRVIESIKKRKGDEREALKKKAQAISNKLKEIEPLFQSVTSGLTGFQAETNHDNGENGLITEVKLSVWKIRPNDTGEGPIDRRSDYDLLAHPDENNDRIQFSYSKANTEEHLSKVSIAPSSPDIDLLGVKDALVEFITFVGNDCL